MQLSYRGIKYNAPQSAVTVTDAETTATYRGANYKVKRATNTATQAHPEGLKYRGVVVR